MSLKTNAESEHGYVSKMMRSHHNIKKIEDMHDKFGVTDWVTAKMKDGDYETLKRFIEFRIDTQLREELEETSEAVSQGNAEEIVDGLIDILVFAYGTLDVLAVDADEAFDRVTRANMAKEPGIKPGRPNPWGLPDLVKPEGWVAPDHEDNHGILDIIYKDESELKW